MVTVIVPVYNSEKYLAQCIDSILLQTFSDFQLILVNDGSNDSSGDICDEFAKKDERILVIHKKNGGQNSAIRAGFKKAEGEYIFFVDSDDWVEPNAISVLYEAIKNNSADLSAANAFRNSKTELPFKLHHCEEGIYDREKIEKRVYPNLLCRINQNFVSVLPSRCGKLFRKNLISKIIEYCDEDIRIGEDKLLTYPYIMICNKIVFLNEQINHYRENQASISYTYDKNRMEEQKKLISILTQISSAITDYDFSMQLEAMTVEAVNITISGLRGQLLSQEIKERFRNALNDNTVSRELHPYPRRIFEHIKYHLIIRRRFCILWIYCKLASYINLKIFKR